MIKDIEMGKLFWIVQVEPVQSICIITSREPFLAMVRERDVTTKVVSERFYVAGFEDDKRP